MSNDLKPCPHCGGNVAILPMPHNGISAPLTYIGCKNCHAVTSVEAPREVAIKTWNKREPQIH